MFYVHCIASETDPARRYIGFTVNLRHRLVDHNRGCNPSTASFKPWKLRGYLAFERKADALEFERYLKTGSGHAFRKKRLW